MSDPQNEENQPKTLEEIFWFVMYHVGLFFLKIAVIVVTWLFLADTLRKIMM
jgi:hypothetical protein